MEIREEELSSGCWVRNASQSTPGFEGDCVIVQVGGCIGESEIRLYSVRMVLLVLGHAGERV